MTKDKKMTAAALKGQIDDMVVAACGPNLVDRLAGKRAEEKLNGCVDVAYEAYKGVLGLQAAVSKILPDVKTFDSRHTETNHYSANQMTILKNTQAALDEVHNALNKVLQHNTDEENPTKVEEFNTDFEALSQAVAKNKKAFPTAFV